MSRSHGSFVWYELMTNDCAAAEAFYRGVIGWKAQDSGLPNQSYTILSAAQTPIGGLMALPPEVRAAGGRPAWSGYILVEDVDAFAARVKKAGGAIHHPPEDIPGVGRFAVVADPQGAVFMLFRGSSDMPAAPTAPGTPCHAGWHELHTSDPERAFAFYSGLFGWTKDRVFDMGPMGPYQLFATGGEAVGGMMTRGEATPAPVWLYYFNVEDAAAAAARVKDHKGQVLNGPHQVLSGNWIVQCRDPQGAMFALVAPATAMETAKGS